MSEHTKARIALYMCGAHRGGKTVKQIKSIINQGVTKIIVEESGLKQQRDDLLAVCKELLYALTWVGSRVEEEAQIIEKAEAAIAKADK